MGLCRNEVFPFHLEYIDLATPRNIVEACAMQSMQGTPDTALALALNRCAALADDIGTARGFNSVEHIAVQPGGPVITKFIQTLMNQERCSRPRPRLSDL